MEEALTIVGLGTLLLVTSLLDPVPSQIMGELCVSCSREQQLMLSNDRPVRKDGKMARRFMVRVLPRCDSGWQLTFPRSR